MANLVDHVSRHLLGGDGLNMDQGPIAILVVVCVLFCIIWTPMLCHRSCPHMRRYGWGIGRNHQREADRQAEIIRVSLENLRRLGLEDALYNRARPALASAEWNPIQRMNLEDRRAYINNLLVSRKILKVSKEGPPTDDGDWGEDWTVKSGSGSPGRKTSLLLADLVDVESTTKIVSVEPCAICLNDYVEDEILCWSQNSQCQHCFHKDCAVEWLMNHEECPLCRYNYLSLDGDEQAQQQPPGGGAHLELSTMNISLARAFPTSREADEALAGASEDDANSFFRGMNLFYVLSQLQSLADSRPDTTFRLEGIELADGQRGNLEIQHATAESSTLYVQGRGMNIRIMPDENDAAMDPTRVIWDASEVGILGQNLSTAAIAPTATASGDSDPTERADHDDSPRSRPDTGNAADSLRLVNDQNDADNIT